MKLDGLSVPMPTLFAPDGSLDAASNARFARGLSEAGVPHVFVLGTLGEFPLVTDAERGPLLEAVIESLSPRTDAWVGCGAPSTGQAVANAKRADEAGAAAVVVTPPYYLVPTEPAIERYYREIRRATRLPLLAYNIPSHVGYALTPPLVHGLAREKVLAGIKDTSASLDSVQGFLYDAPDGFAVFPGDDALAAAGIARGARGAVMGSANVLPKLALRLVEAAMEGDLNEVARLQRPLETLVRVVQSGPFPSTVKFLAERLRGAPVGYRSPYDPLSPEEEARVQTALLPVENELKAFL